MSDVEISGLLKYATVLPILPPHVSAASHWSVQWWSWRTKKGQTCVSLEHWWMCPGEGEQCLRGGGPWNKTAYFTLWPDNSLLYFVHLNTGENNLGRWKEQRTKKKKLWFQVLALPFCESVTLGKSLDLFETQFFHPSDTNNNLWPIFFQGYGEDDKRKGMWKSLSTAEDERFLLLENMSSG